MPLTTTLKTSCVVTSGFTRVFLSILSTLRCMNYQLPELPFFSLSSFKMCGHELPEFAGEWKLEVHTLLKSCQRWERTDLQDTLLNLCVLFTDLKLACCNLRVHLQSILFIWTYVNYGTQRLLFLYNKQSVFMCFYFFVGSVAILLSQWSRSKQVTNLNLFF